MKKRKHKNHRNKKIKHVTYGFDDPDYGVEFGYDEDFSFIAGFTGGFAPYGTTWEEDGIDPTLPFEEKFRLLQEKWDKENKQSSKSTNDLDELKEKIFDLFEIEAEIEESDTNDEFADISVDDLPFY